VVAEDGPNGLCNIGRGEHGKRDLVKERLKRVVIAAIDERDVDWQLGRFHCCVNAGKSSTDDKNAFSFHR
jgi:hypothetical protein